MRAFCPLLLVLVGCADLECPPGQEKRGDACRLLTDDAGTNEQDTAAVAQQTDAGDASSSSLACTASAQELCNGLDDNCNGEIDEGAMSYADYDGDGFGGELVPGCPRPSVVAKGGDCDDANPKLNPGAAEVCNGADENCNGERDEGVTTVVYRDADGDGRGDRMQPKSVCNGALADGYVISNDDCDDQCKTCSPQNLFEQLCDGEDDDCDGQVDDGLFVTRHLDCDGDGYPQPNSKQQVCRAAPAPTSCGGGRWLSDPPLNPNDCNDNDPAIRSCP